MKARKTETKNKTGVKEMITVETDRDDARITKIINGGRTVYIIQHSEKSVEARLYVGGEEMIATLTAWSGKTVKGAVKWGKKQVLN